MQLVHGLRFDNLRGDLFGGLTAAVVALPLALAFGVASGAGPIAGLYGAIFVGLFAALFGGTPSQISGPTGPMTVVMAGVFTQYAGDPVAAFTVVMMAGLCQIAFGMMKLGRYITLMPFPVISGFMSGIGCIIIILQIGPFLGHAGAGGGPLAALRAIPSHIGGANIDAVLVGGIALAIVFLTPGRISRIVPAPLIALVIGTLCALVVFPAAPILGTIPTGLPDIRVPSITFETLPTMVGSALVLGVLGAIDSLLTSLIADNVTNTHHDSDRELVGQGIGNLVAGLFGGIPGAGATMRTVVNVRSGGRTPISGTLHALVLLALALGLGPLAEKIPHAVLAGILFKVGIEIIDWNYLRRLRTAPRAGLVLMLVVLLLTVFVDLIMAVGVGLVLASLLFVKRMADLQLDSVKLVDGNADDHLVPPDEFDILHQAGGRILMLRLAGPLSFGAANGLVRRLSASGHYEILVLDFTDLTMLDSSASIAIEQIISQTQANSGEVILAAMSAEIAEVLGRMQVLRLVSEDNIAGTRREALERAVARLEREAPSGEQTV